jgi:hypothetical protein
MGARFWISGVVMAFLSLMTDFVVHGMLLYGDYSALPNLMRPEAEAGGYFSWMLLAHLLIGFGLTWIYRKGREAGRPPVGQGLRFGVAIIVLVTIPNYLIYYAVQPWPGAVVAKQIVYEAIAVLLLGVVVALINRDPKTA